MDVHTQEFFITDCIWPNFSPHDPTWSHVTPLNPDLDEVPQNLHLSVILSHFSLKSSFRASLPYSNFVYKPHSLIFSSHLIKISTQIENCGICLWFLTQYVLNCQKTSKCSFSQLCWALLIKFGSSRFFYFLCVSGPRKYMCHESQQKRHTLIEMKSQTPDRRMN